MKRLLTLCLLLCFGTITFSQQHICGLPGGEEDTRLIKRLKNNQRFLETHGEQRSGAIRYVPVVFHNIKASDGSGGLADSKFLDQLCNLNEFYMEQETELQFVLQEINVITNDNAYDNHTGSGNSVLVGNKRNKVVNIFVPKNANTTTQSLGTTLGYYSPSADWIVLRPAEVNRTSTTLNHEMGHFLSLAHPFRGWDFEAYDPGAHGVKVGQFAPSVNFQFAILNEKQDGSNCTQAADMLCDTPPDYNHFDTNWGCNYDGKAQDPNCEEIDPDERNVMSYFGSCTPEAFSEDQIAVMNADLSTRTIFGSINLAGVPGGNLGASITPTEPINDEAIADNGAILFDWDDVPNADAYVFELDRFNNFGFQPQRFTVTESELTFDGSELFLDKQYWWKVRPFNSHDQCVTWSEDQSFFTSIVSSVETIAGVESVVLRPNPATVGTKMELIFSSNLAFEATIKLININGVVSQFDQRLIGQGQNKISLPTSELPAGIYFLQLSSEEGTIQEKFVVQ